MPAPEKIRAEQAYFIRLGEGGKWAEQALARGEMHFGDPSPGAHALALDGDWPGVGENWLAAGLTRPDRLTSDLREVRAFYTLGPETLWLTMFKGRLYWAFAAPEVFETKTDASASGAFARKTLGGWRSTDVAGLPLTRDRVSSAIWKTTGYQRTICRFADPERVIRRINAEVPDAVTAVREAEKAVTETVERMLPLLDWKDFEALVDLIFLRLGWRRLGELGGTQADADFVAEQPLTGERAFVQVKMDATPAQVRAALEAFDLTAAHERFVFACLRCRGAVDLGARANAELWLGAALAQRAIDAGLVRWLANMVR